MTVPTFLLYLVTWLVVALSPGPAVMLSVAQATKHGFRASLSGIAWIQCGNLIFFVGAGARLGRALVIRRRCLHGPARRRGGLPFLSRGPGGGAELSSP